jgi:formylglycine-generating enzyme required for sulfatase activity
MVDEQLIRDIEQALNALKAGDDSAADRLATIFGGNRITAGNIEYATGVAIGRNIRQIIIIQGPAPELAAKLDTVLVLLERLLTKVAAPAAEPLQLPEVFTPVAEDARVRRRGATPRVFISYSHVDLPLVNHIAQRLAREHYYDVWIDYDSIPLGENWKRSIAEGIAAADRVLFMASPDALASAACREEVRYARGQGRRIIPIRIRSTLKWEDLSALQLHESQGLDFSAGDTPERWERLLDNLPPVLARDRRRNDEVFWARHTDYLRWLFNRFGRIDLTDLLEGASLLAKVNLTDIYVPLKLTLGISILKKDGAFLDWWVEEYDSLGARRRAEEAGGTDRPKRYSSLRADKSILLQIVQEIERKLLERNDLEDGKSEWYLESEEAPALEPHLVITGNAGSGKTTLMRHLALCMAGDQLANMGESSHSGADLEHLGFWPWPAYTPIVISLRDLVSKEFPRHDSGCPAEDAITPQLLFDYLAREQLKPAGVPGYLDDLKAQLRGGDAMVFLDGLDEVPDADQTARREQIKQFVRILRDLYPRCRILVTSRPYAYAGDWFLDGFGQVSLAPLGESRLQRLAERLFCVVLGDAEAARKEACEFRESMTSIEEELRRSPLFFTLLAAIWLDNSGRPAAERLPAGKGGIYRACVDMLVRRWTRKDLTGKSVLETIGLDEAQLRDVLETLAYRVQRDAAAGAGAPFAAGTIQNVVRPMGIRGLDYDHLLDTLSQRAGIIYELDPGNSEQGRDPMFTFAHPSFQEHLAAAHLTHPERYPQLLLEDVRRGPALWRNVLELLPDECARRKVSLWEVVRGLLPEDLTLPDQVDDPAWQLVYFAGRWITDTLPAGDDGQIIYRPRLRRALAALVSAGALAPGERAEMGRALSGLGDPRPGVGVRADHLPDIDWVEVPGGDFIYQDGEQRLEPGYFIARYPVTFEQFQAFLDAEDGFRDTRWWVGLSASEEHRGVAAEQMFQRANHPREHVSWYDAIAFCRWLTDKARQCPDLLPTEAPHDWVVTLPTEWQWEKAARGGLQLPDGRRNPDPRREYPYEGAFDASRGGNTAETGIEQTTAVGIFPHGASPYGVLDMSGNVWEWCLNEYDRPERIALKGAAGRMVRGGSWLYHLDRARAAFRLRDSPYYRFNNLGFRVVCRPPCPEH